MLRTLVVLLGQLDAVPGSAVDTLGDGRRGDRHDRDGRHGELLEQLADRS